jgi:hypothetical protein
VQEDRELANATINKLRGTFSMLYKHGKRKGLVNVNPAVMFHSRTPGTVSEGKENYFELPRQFGETVGIRQKAAFS